MSYSDGLLQDLKSLTSFNSHSELCALANTSCMAHLKSLASAVAEILIGTPKFWGGPLKPTKFYAI